MSKKLSELRIYLAIVSITAGFEIKTFASIDMKQLRKNPFNAFDSDTITRFNFIVFNDGQGV